MNYVGIDWAYGRAAWCARSESGAIAGEGLIPADEDGLARLALRLGPEVKACVEMMSGAIWVSDQLERAGWKVQVAHARKVRDIAPLACKTDKVDARVLAELCRRDLVPGGLGRLAARTARSVSACAGGRTWSGCATSARNRIFGLLTQFGLRISLTRLRQRRTRWSCSRSSGVPEVWRRLDRRALDVIDGSTRGSRRSTTSCARSRAPTQRAGCCRRSRAIGPLIGLTFASEIGDVSASPRPRSWSAMPAWPRGSASRASARPPARLSKAGSRTLRWAAVEAAQQAWRPTNPLHELYRRLAAAPRQEPGEVLGRAQAPDRLLAHALAQTFRPSAPRRSILPRQAPRAFWPPDGPAWN